MKQRKSRRNTYPWACRHVHITQKHRIVNCNTKNIIKVKKYSNNEISDKHSLKMSLEFVFCWPSTAGHGTANKCYLVIQWDSIGKVFFFFEQMFLEIASWYRMGTGIYFSMETSGFDLCRLYACCLSLWEYMCIRHCFLAIIHSLWL